MAVARGSLALALVLLMCMTSLAVAADSAATKLESQNDSGESGTATLTRAGDNQTRVILEVEGAPSGPQPVHIHRGTCAKLDPRPAYPLAPLVNGKSETTVKTSLDSLQKGGYAISGHQSSRDSSNVFCGDIGSM